MASTNSEQGTEEDFQNISLYELLHSGLNVVDIICQRLNPPKIIPTDDRLYRDWRGLAVVTGFNAQEISYLAAENNKTFTLLKRWCEKEKSTLRQLLLHLEQLDRFDIADDITELIKNGGYSVSEFNNALSTQQYVLSPEDRDALRKGQPLVNYHAFLLYANEDVEFASTLVKKMEEEFSPPLKIFVKDRDLVVGAMDYNSTIKMIAERCNRLIVVLSPAFVRSPENSFFISFAQSIGIDQRRRKIIPCIYAQCEIPTELKPLHMIDYRRPTGPLYNFWDKLYKSISIPSIDSSNFPMPSMVSNSTISKGSMDLISSAYNRSSSIVNSVSDTLPAESNDNTNTSTTDLSKSSKSKSKFPWRFVKSLPRLIRDHRKKEKVSVPS